MSTELIEMVKIIAELESNSKDNKKNAFKAFRGFAQIMLKQLSENKEIVLELPFPRKGMGEYWDVWSSVMKNKLNIYERDQLKKILGYLKWKCKIIAEKEEKKEAGSRKTEKGKGKKTF